MKHISQWLGKADFENADFEYKSVLNPDKPEKWAKGKNLDFGIEMAAVPFKDQDGDDVDFVEVETPKA